MMKEYKKTVSKLALVIGAGALLAACSTSSHDERDPFEGFNRAVFSFNKVVDDTVIHPVVKVYRAVLPNPVRTGFKNFLFNLKAPIRFANQLLQGDVGGAGDEFVRTTVNTLLGAGGVFDIAGHEGIKAEREDFGQTLGVWGVGHGPYVVVPIIGPSSMRDYIGYAVDAFFDPVRLYAHNVDKEGLYYAKLGADYLVLRDDLIDLLEELEASSIDYYAAVRSSYFQNRQAMVKDSNSSDLDSFDIPDYED